MPYQVNGVLACSGPAGVSHCSFSIADREQTKQWFIDQWSTRDQQIYNAMHETCPACKGRGYAVYRRNGVTVRENVGCSVCLGLGAVPRVSRADAQASTYRPLYGAANE